MALLLLYGKWPISPDLLRAGGQGPRQAYFCIPCELDTINMDGDSGYLGRGGEGRAL